MFLTMRVKELLFRSRINCTWTLHRSRYDSLKRVYREDYRDRFSHGNVFLMDVLSSNNLSPYGPIEFLRIDDFHVTDDVETQCDKLSVDWLSMERLIEVSSVRRLSLFHNQFTVVQKPFYCCNPYIARVSESLQAREKILESRAKKNHY